MITSMSAQPWGSSSGVPGTGSGDSIGEDAGMAVSTVSTS